MTNKTRHYFHFSCIFAVILAILLIAVIITADRMSAERSSAIIKQEIAQMNHTDKMMMQLPHTGLDHKTKV